MKLDWHEQLEEKVREKVNEEFKDKVTFQVEHDQFVRYVLCVHWSVGVWQMWNHPSVISSGITVLLRELEFATEPPFSTMARTAWPTLNQVSGQSAYVGELVNIVESVMDAIKPLIDQKKYLRNLFDKASRHVWLTFALKLRRYWYGVYSLILTKFTNTIVKSRPLKDIGAEQVGSTIKLARVSTNNFSASHWSPDSESLSAQTAWRGAINIEVSYLPQKLWFQRHLLAVQLHPQPDEKHHKGRDFAESDRHSSGE